MNIRSFIGAAALGLAIGCYADTVYLTNGQEIEGSVIDENNGNVTVKATNGRLHSLRRKDIDTIVYSRKVATPPPVDKTDEAKKAETPPAKDETKTEKPADGTATPVDPNAKPPAAGDKASTEMQSFPKGAKRMGKAKEAVFMDAMEQLANPEEAPRKAAKDEIAALGNDVIPYLVAGIQHANVEARTSCMQLLGQLNARNAVKPVVEAFYAAMPESGAAATWNVIYIRAIKNTLQTITGQSFITVEADKPLVQDGLKKYVEWYDQNFDRLARQVGEPVIEATDPDYFKKLKEARALKLEKREFPRPAMPADLISPKKPNDPNAPIRAVDNVDRNVDKEFRDGFQKIERKDSLNRGNEREANPGRDNETTKDPFKRPNDVK